MAAFLKTPGGPLSLRNGFYESRPTGHNQPNLLPYYPFYVKQAELKGYRAWNLTNGLHGLIEKMVDKCERQNVEIKVKSQAPQWSCLVTLHHNGLIEASVTCLDQVNLAQCDQGPPLLR